MNRLNDIPNPWLALNAEPSSSDGGVESRHADGQPTMPDPNGERTSDKSANRRAGVAPGPSDSIDCIAEIFAGHAKANRRFVFDRAAFELALIEPPPLRHVA